MLLAKVVGVKILPNYPIVQIALEVNVIIFEVSKTTPETQVKAV